MVSECNTNTHILFINTFAYAHIHLLAFTHMHNEQLQLHLSQTLLYSTIQGRNFSAASRVKFKIDNRGEYVCMQSG